MRIWTEVSWAIDGSDVPRGKSIEYDGPLAKCDRAIQNDATNAATNATQTAGQFGAGAGSVQANLVPRLETQAVTPPGIGAFGLGEEETGALSTAAGATGSATEGARLRAIRTGNAAGVGAMGVAAAGETARASGGALQSILAKNAQLKAQQMQQANTGLEGILGENIHGETAAEGIVPEDLNTALKAGQQGWLQNAEGVLTTLSQAGASAGKMAGLPG